MSTEAAAAVAAPITTPTTAYEVTRGGAYLIEGLLQHHTEYTTTIPLTKKASKLRRKLKQQNPCVLDGKDLEKTVIKNAADTDIEWTLRQDTHREDFRRWQDQKVKLELTAKEKDFLCNKALKWAFANRTKVFPENNDHVLSIIEAFDLEDDGE